MYGFQCLFQKRAFQILKVVEQHNGELSNDVHRARIVAFLIDNKRPNSLSSIKQRIDRADPLLRNDKSFQFIRQAYMPKFIPRDSVDTLMQTCECETCVLWFSSVTPQITNNFLSQVYKRMN